MKKVLVIILVLAVVVLGWYALRNVRMSFTGEKGELQRVKRDDLTIPINATGEVRYKRQTEIKSEASGTVAARFFEAGDRIHKGDLLIQLTPDDEQRNKDRAEADLIRAQANLDRAKITLRERREIGVAKAQANLAAIVAQLADAANDWERIRKLYEGKESNNREYVSAKTSYERLLASKAGAEADLGQAGIAIEMAEKDVILADAAKTTAQRNFSDAEERLRDTEVFSPSDGIIMQMLVQEGEVIQTGKESFTGGTVLAVVADDSEVYVRAEVDEADFGVIREIAPASARPGGNLPAVADDPPEAPIDKDSATVRVLVEAYRDEDFRGAIERIYPEPRKAASVVTYYVDILLTSANRDKLAVGMQADVEFTAQSVHDALLVQHDAIHKEDNQLGVYLPVKVEGKPDPEPKFVKCRFGLDNGLLAEVLEGEIKEGDWVYTKLPRAPEEEK
ncbi:MAG: HlyD family efflux transporter periplasmic adaptor subunit [Planctomycetota bacterium]